MLQGAGKFGERHHGPDGHTWSGAYMAVSGEFPVVQYGCLVDVGLNGELQGWYFGSDRDADGGATAIAGSSALKPSSTISAPPPLARIPGRTISTGTPNKVAMP